MKPEALTKIKMINASRRCLTFALLSLIPGIGLLFALITLGFAGSIRAAEKSNWNAAQTYRILATICATICAILWGGLLLFIFGNVIMSNWFPNY